MNLLRLLVCCAAFCLFVAGVPCEDKKSDKASDDAALLVGSWEVVKVSKGSNPPVGTIVEFSKDGTVTYKSGDKATYKLDGDKLTMTAKLGDKEATQTATIKKLTESELVTEENGKVIEWQRKKGS